MNLQVMYDITFELVLLITFNPLNTNGQCNRLFVFVQEPELRFQRLMSVNYYLSEDMLQSCREQWNYVTSCLTPQPYPLSFFSMVCSVAERSKRFSSKAPSLQP